MTHSILQRKCVFDAYFETIMVMVFYFKLSKLGSLCRTESPLNYICFDNDNWNANSESLNNVIFENIPKPSKHECGEKDVLLRKL